MIVYKIPTRPLRAKSYIALNFSHIEYHSMHHVLYKVTKSIPITLRKLPTYIINNHPIIFCSLALGKKTWWKKNNLKIVFYIFEVKGSSSLYMYKNYSKSMNPKVRIHQYLKRVSKLHWNCIMKGWFGAQSRAQDWVRMGCPDLLQLSC